MKAVPKQNFEEIKEIFKNEKVQETVAADRWNKEVQSLLSKKIQFQRENTPILQKMK